MISFLILFPDFQSHHTTACNVIFLPRKLHLFISAGLQLAHIFGVQCHLRPFSTLTPRRCFNLNYLPVSFSENQFKPHCYSVGTSFHWCFYFELCTNVIYLFV